MKQIRIAPIVEGHGEVAAVPLLLRKLWLHLGGEDIQVLRPFREKRDRLAADKDQALTRAVNFAYSRLSERNDLPGLIMIMLDADTDLPCQLAPALLQIAGSARTDADISCVVVKREFETWFVAAAESLSKYLRLPEPAQIPVDPENSGQGKGWIEEYFRGPKYSETVDQPKLTAAMDIEICRKRSASFDKLCRELERRLAS